MKVATGRVVNGRIEVDWNELPEGRTVGVIVPDDDGFELSADEEAELVAALEEADAGESVDAAEVVRQLRSRFERA